MCSMQYLKSCVYVFFRGGVKEVQKCLMFIPPSVTCIFAHVVNAILFSVQATMSSIVIIHTLYVTPDFITKSCENTVNCHFLKPFYFSRQNRRPYRDLAVPRMRTRNRKFSHENVSKLDFSWICQILFNKTRQLFE